MARGRAVDSDASSSGPLEVMAEHAVHADEEGLSLLLLLQVHLGLHPLLSRPCRHHFLLFLPLLPHLLDQ
ncbi:hypothetical protein JCGZ_03935 [Jatropha curcas]|uniref:Uncharacterized protein n=1 Tax=Jatropha curcas TaxID=180498 RepID=A0A067L6U2_JATCU|nr:hypothetical protein JCGZ_03935 [Jatropha curcas]